MNDLIKQEPDAIRNSAVVREEQLGRAAELAPQQTATVVDDRMSVMHSLSVLEIIA